MTTKMICKNLQGMLDDPLRHAEMTGWQIVAVNEAITALRARQEREKNEPLTLEELREMDGEPVWVQSPGMPEYGRWAIVEGVDIEQKILWLRADYTCHDYGKVWLAYRHKPKEK